MRLSPTGIWKAIAGYGWAPTMTWDEMAIGRRPCFGQITWRGEPYLCGLTVQAARLVLQAPRRLAPGRRDGSVA